MVLICLFLLGGCTTTGRTAATDQALTSFYFGDYESAKRVLAPLAEKTDENYVLNNLRLGSVALADYDYDGAEAAFLRAYEVMNSTGVNDGGRGAAAAIVHEGIKIWKGEPYERAMCSFYLGLIYYEQLDYNNARASFENALFKLRDYSKSDKDEKYDEVESDFVSAQIMLAKCWQKLGNDDKARDILTKAAKLRPAIKSLASENTTAQSNVLLVVDFGDGPRKVNEYDSSVVTFWPTPAQVGPVPPARVLLDGKRLDIRGDDMAPVDLLELAQDRRWQSIDTIRLAKSIVGTGLMAGGAARTATARKEGQAWTGVGLMAAGALLKASGGADLRFWETLPRTTFIIPLRLPPGDHNLTVEFGQGLSQALHGVTAPETGEATYYVRVFRQARKAIAFQ